MGSREQDQNNTAGAKQNDNCSNELIEALVIITGEGSTSMAIHSASNPFSSGNPFSTYLKKHVAHLPQASAPNQIGLTHYVGVGERKAMTNHEAFEHLMTIREAFPEGTQNREYVDVQLAKLKSNLEEPFKKLAQLSGFDTSQSNARAITSGKTSSIGHLI